MTGNLTNTGLLTLDLLSHAQPRVEEANMRLRNALEGARGFFAGCVAGAVSVSWMAGWAWLLPVILAGLAITLPEVTQH